MSHPFSSSFEALHAHFKRQPPAPPAQEKEAQAMAAHGQSQYPDPSKGQGPYPGAGNVSVPPPQHMSAAPSQSQFVGLSNGQGPYPGISNGPAPEYPFAFGLRPDNSTTTFADGLPSHASALPQPTAIAHAPIGGPGPGPSPYSSPYPAQDQGLWHSHGQSQAQGQPMAFASNNTLGHLPNQPWSNPVVQPEQPQPSYQPPPNAHEMYHYGQGLYPGTSGTHAPGSFLSATPLPELRSQEATIQDQNTNAKPKRKNGGQGDEPRPRKIRAKNPKANLTAESTVNGQLMPPGLLGQSAGFSLRPTDTDGIGLATNNFSNDMPNPDPSAFHSYSDYTSLTTPAPGNGANSLPPNASESATTIGDEAPPMTSTTDALLERMNDLQHAPDVEHHKPTKRFPAARPENSQLQRGQRRGRRGRQGGGQRGPRKAAEPTGDVKLRLEWAMAAYLEQKIDEAIEYVEDAIRINAETLRAWTLLSTLLAEKGEHKESFTARVFSCHLQPKNMEAWLACAQMGEDLGNELPEDRDEFIEQAVFCYSQALRVDIEDRPARHARASLSYERGHTKTAAKDYVYLLERCCFDVFALRGLAEMTTLLTGARKKDLVYTPHVAIDWYRRAFAHFRENGMDARYPLESQDVNSFIGLLLYVEHTKDALYELKSLSRWLLGRSDEDFWNDWQDDDREWDVDSVRRRELEDYQEGRYPYSSYGAGLPLELRTKLAVCRLKLDDVDEAMRHIEFLEPEGPNQSELSENPTILLDVASALYESDRRPMALRFFQPLLEYAEQLDSSSLLAAGRCYLDAEDKTRAEECFTAAIDVDDPNDEACIDARYELAKMYEAAREDREAYILVNEAIKLQETRDGAQEDEDDDEAGDDQEYDVDHGEMQDGEGGKHNATKTKRARPKKPKELKTSRQLQPKKDPKPRKNPGLHPVRRRPRLFARSDELAHEEKERAEALAGAWRTVHETRRRHSEEESAPSDAFMSSAKELVDDFRSYKNFYSWEKYLAHLGIDQPEKAGVVVSRNPNLLDMKERLSHNLNPYGSAPEKKWGDRTAISYRGVPFGDWLDLFLEYAVSLAHAGQYQDAYKVCESARDAEVFAKSREDMFIIHVTWASCALRGRDEEICIAAARYLMRENQFDTDPFRMFAALSRLCPSPASWYASGPIQKYILRQIKLMDQAVGTGVAADSENEGGNEGGPSGNLKPYPSKELDVTLLMLYGHILFVSNSFTYALNYFLRAHSVDPTNVLTMLSIGQCYIHYAMKRQSENRQYLLIQGFLFLHKYYDTRIASPEASIRQEAHYNMARSYHSVGIPHLAVEFYERALRDRPDDSHTGIMGRADLVQEAAFNLQQICWAGGDSEGVKNLAEKYLVS